MWGGRNMSAEYMVLMKVNVGGYEDRDMAVGAVLWGITCTVKGKCMRLWRSWTGKKPEGAEELVGYGLCSTFHCSPTTTTREWPLFFFFFYSLLWEALTHLFTHSPRVNKTYKSKGLSESRRLRENMKSDWHTMWLHWSEVFIKCSHNNR